MIRWPSVTVAARERDDDDGKSGSSFDATIAKMTWEHGDCLLVNL